MNISYCKEFMGKSQEEIRETLWGSCRARIQIGQGQKEKKIQKRRADPS